MKSMNYQVAGHSFRLSFSNSQFPANGLSNYHSFLLNEEAESYLFHLSVTDSLSMACAYSEVGRFDDDIASIAISKSEEGNFRFRIAYPGSNHYCTMDVDASFREARVQLPGDERHRFFCLNNCLMLLYAFATSGLDTLLIHASVIKNSNEGFVFLGKSGTGKSTHSRLWLDHIEGSELLNDDNPVIRIIDGKAYIFGTPWSGKTPCYKSESVPLRGIVKLRQAPENRIKSLSLLQAYATVLPSCSSMRWEEQVATGVHCSVEKLIATVGCYHLDCLPDSAAARLCYNTIR
jgi:hypothetical protein